MTNEQAVEIIKGISQWEYWQNDTLEAFILAIKALETGEVYMTGEDYNLYMEGYKAGKKDFAPKQGEWVEKYEKILQIVEHWNDKSSSFVSACEAFEKILDVTKGGAE